VHAPQFVVWQPTCVPVNPSSSRSQWTSRVRASTTDSMDSPFTVARTRTVALISLLPIDPLLPVGCYDSSQPSGNVPARHVAGGL
jgi:hypothetical protein